MDWWETLVAYLAVQQSRIEQAIDEIVGGVSWPGGSKPIPASRWSAVAIPSTGNVLATITHPAPGPGKLLVVSQVVFTTANSAVTTSSTRACLLTDDVGTRLFGGLVAVPALIGYSDKLESYGPINVAENKGVTAAFGSAGGVGVFQAVSMAGYVAEMPEIG